MKLQQGQIWKCGEEYVRIVYLERLEVGYLSRKSLGSSTSKKQRTTQKGVLPDAQRRNPTLGSPEVIGGDASVVVPRQVRTGDQHFLPPSKPVSQEPRPYQ